jgi:hypothetical protein
MTEKKTTTTITKSALRQIHDAIDLFHQSKFDSAVTVAHAAQGMMPKTENPHFSHKLEALAKALEAVGDERPTKPNDIANWLKHGHAEMKGAVITEVEAIAVIVRAISKYIATYGGLSPKMGEFRDWAIDRVIALRKAGD